MIGVVALFLTSTAVAGAIDLDTGSHAPTDVSSAQQSASSGYADEINLTEADVKYAGEGVNDTAGQSVASAGDVNGDGVDDLIIGAPRNSSAGPNTGAAYIVYGPADPGEVNLSDADVTLRGVTNNELAGWSVSTAGDVNGDGIDDVVVGAPGNDTAAPNGGAAFVVYGGESLPAEMNLSAEDADAVLAGTEAYGQAGYSVSEVNRSGADGVAVGAPYANTTGPNAGAAYMVSGLTLGEAPGSVLNLSEADAAYLGERDGSHAGWSVSTAGDVDDDGTEDIIVGAPGYNATAAESATDEAQNRTGAAYVVDSSDWDTNSLADASLTLIGESAGDRAGWSVSNAGDVNNDTTADLLVGAPFNDSHNETDAGAAYVVYGGDSLAGEQSLADADVRMAGAAALDRAGWSVSAAGSGDVTCDRVDDVLVGAPYNDSTAENAGAAYLVSGEAGLDGDLNLTDADTTFFGENGTDRAGYAVSEAGDLNDDGSEDVAIGAPNNDSNDRMDAGAAYVLFSDCPEEVGAETETPTDTATPTETETEQPAPETETPTETETPATETETPTETKTKTPETDTETPGVETETETPETDTPGTDTDTPATDTDTPATDTDTETPVTDTKTPETATDTDTETPATDTDTETPETDTDTETPETDTDTETPETDTDTETPETDTDTETPATDTDTETPATDTDTETPMTDTDTETPETDTDTQTPETDTDTPETDTDTETPMTDTDTETPMTDTDTETPMTDTDTETPGEEPTLDFRGCSQVIISGLEVGDEVEVVAIDNDGDTATFTTTATSSELSVDFENDAFDGLEEPKIYQVRVNGDLIGTNSNVEQNNQGMYTCAGAGGGNNGNNGNAPAGDQAALETLSQSPAFPAPFFGLMALSIAVLATTRTREN
ncbi:hypothetical protein [Halosimplex sp. J119]